MPTVLTTSPNWLPSRRPYLYFVEDTRKGAHVKPSIGETANCKLQLPDSYDYHIGLGFGPALAQQILKTKPKSVFGKPGPIDKTSVVAEMTPHTRAPKWTFARVNSLQGPAGQSCWTTDDR